MHGMLSRMPFLLAVVGVRAAVLGCTVGSLVRSQNNAVASFFEHDGAMYNMLFQACRHTVV